MRATAKMFSYFLVGALAFIAVLTPNATQAQGTGTDTGNLNIAVFECPGLEAPGAMDAPVGVPDDCVPSYGSFDFYLSGDGSGEPVTWAEVDGTADIPLIAGTYTVHETTTDTPVGEFTLEAGQGTAIVFGIPLGSADPGPGVPGPGTGADTGNLNIAVFECPGLDAPGPMSAPVGVPEDCVPGFGFFNFYLSGDGSGEPVTWAEVNGTTDIPLIAGTYTVHETTTDTPAGEFTLAAGEGTAIVFGIPLVTPPPTDTGILSVSTYSCAQLNEAVVLDEISDDCVRISTDLSFYLWGDGTDDFWPLTTSDSAAVDIELPVGDYEVIDEPTQWSVPATVVEEGSSVSFGFPAYQAPVDPPATDPDPADPDPVAPPVSELPETGVGTGSHVGTLGALVSGALLAAGALGARIRKS